MGEWERNNLRKSKINRQLYIPLLFSNINLHNFLSIIIIHIKCFKTNSIIKKLLKFIFLLISHNGISCWIKKGTNFWCRIWGRNRPEKKWWVKNWESVKKNLEIISTFIIITKIKIPNFLITNKRIKRGRYYSFRKWNNKLI